MFSIWFDKFKQFNWLGWLARAIVIIPAVYFLANDMYTAFMVFLGIMFALFLVWFWCIVKLNVKYDRAEMGWILDDQGRDIDSNPQRRRRIQLLAPFYLAYFTYRDRNKDWII